MYISSVILVKYGVCLWDFVFVMFRFFQQILLRWWKCVGIYKQVHL